MKKKIFFGLYCVLMIGGLVLFLIFYPNFSNNTELKTKPPQSEQPENNPENTPSDDNDQNKDETEKEEIFATKIKLKCEDDIILSIGSSVELLTGFISVEPAKYLNNITTSISVESGATNGINFSNNKINAYAIGRYRIEFKVPKTKNTEIYDVLSVRVVEKENDDKVKLINNNFTNNTTISLSEVVEINELYTNYSITNTDYLTYSNNKITFISVGSSNLNLSINANYLTYRYSFGFTINQKITSRIFVENEDNGILEIDAEVGDYFEIVYYEKTASGENIPQMAIMTAETDGIIQIFPVHPPIITCKCLSKTSVKITITPTNTEIPPKELIIVFK